MQYDQNSAQYNFLLFVYFYLFIIYSIKAMINAMMPVQLPCFEVQHRHHHGRIYCITEITTLYFFFFSSSNLFVRSSKSISSVVSLGFLTLFVPGTLGRSGMVGKSGRLKSALVSSPNFERGLGLGLSSSWKAKVKCMVIHLA